MESKEDMIRDQDLADAIADWKACQASGRKDCGERPQAERPLLLGPVLPPKPEDIPEDMIVCNPEDPDEVCMVLPPPPPSPKYLDEPTEDPVTAYKLCMASGRPDCKQPRDGGMINPAMDDDHPWLVNGDPMEGSTTKKEKDDGFDIKKILDDIFNNEGASSLNLTVSVFAAVALAT